MGAQERRVWSGVTGLVLSVALAPPVFAADANTDEDVIYLEPVTVTANKRPQAMSDLDANIDVRTREDLERAGVTTVEDLEKVFPGLQIRARSNDVYSNITVRGVNSSDYYTPAVPVYVDGVPQDPAFLTQDLVNVERVELLRGPQGTLYGRNAYAGVINIVTSQPDDAVHMRVGGQLADPVSQAEASASGPILPGYLFGEISGRWGRDGGRIDDTATGDDNIDEATSRSGRLRLRLAPTGTGLDVSVTAQREELESYEEIAILNPDERTFDSTGMTKLPYTDRTVTTFSLNANYDVGPGTLTSVTAYQDRIMDRILWSNGAINFPESQETISQELRYAFDLSMGLSGVVGGFFQDADFTRKTDPISFGGFANALGPSRNEIKTQSYALFGEATYDITPSIDITAGLRWSYEETEIDFARSAGSFMGAVAFDSSDHDSAITPKVSVGWAVTPDHRLYATYSQGFKPGGFNHSIPSSASSAASESVAYDSETSNNFEIGWRGHFFDDRLELKSAAYWVETSDKQIYMGAIGRQYLNNVGDARSIGVEVQAMVQPTPDWRITAGGTFGRSTFVDAMDGATGADYDGNRLPYAPDVTLQGAVEYRVPQTFLPGDLYLRGAARYNSETYFDEANTMSQDGFALFDASVTLAMDSGLTLTAFADNLTDKAYRTYSYEDTAGVVSTIGEGRVVGVRGAWSF